MAQQATAVACPWVAPIPIIGLTGKHASGKTLFGLMIDPVNTLAFDFEKSSACYASLGFTRVDCIDEMSKRHAKGYKPVDLWVWWREYIRTIPALKYSVIMLDPISELESGLADWVKANPKEFGKTPAQYAKAGGLYWADVKEYWKQVLSELAAKCYTLVCVAHMKQIWAGEKPTGKQIPKGKETIHELASLYLEMERIPNAKGEYPAEPSAKVLKGRLMSSTIDPETKRLKVVPAMPPRIHPGTPDRIREYQRTPPDYGQLKASERAPDVALTEDERLSLRLQVAETEKEVELARIERDASSRPRETIPVKAQGEQPATTPVSAPGGQADAVLVESEPPTLLEQIVDLRARLFDLLLPGAPPEAAQPKWLEILWKHNVKTARDLDDAGKSRLILELEEMIASGELHEMFGGKGAAAEKPPEPFPVVNVA